MDASFTTSSYFQTQEPPRNLADEQGRTVAFLRRAKAEGKRVVLVTSGGTSVPLEKNMVRFLDNFSAGTRGATSAEYFLAEGYAVIFLHRQHSLLPFSRHYSHSTRPFLDLLRIEPSTDESKPASITVDPAEVARMLPILQRHHDAHTQGTLLMVPYVTVNEYLWLLRAISEVMGGDTGVGREGLFYLACAVSDFFLPSDKMAEHKIQSGSQAGAADGPVEDGRLTLVMEGVPKILKPLVSEWTKEGYVVSFKLETDPKLLLPKARGALDKYGHQLVIGNDLHRRKFEVVFVEPASSGDQDGNADATKSARRYKEAWVRLPEGAVAQGAEIEATIVRELVSRHSRWIAEKDKR